MQTAWEKVHHKLEDDGIIDGVAMERRWAGELVPLSDREMHRIIWDQLGKGLQIHTISKRLRIAGDRIRRFVDVGPDFDNQQSACLVRRTA